MWQRKPIGGGALKGVTTAASPSVMTLVMALRSKQGRDTFPRIVTQPKKGHTPHCHVKRPDQGGLGVPARGPSQLHPTRGTNLNTAKTRSYVEVVRRAVPENGLPTVATGPPHNIHYNVDPRAPTWEAGFSFPGGGGGSIEPSGRTPPQAQKGLN